MVFEISGKIAIVTGGASGLGLQYAQQLLKNGLKGVTLADYDEEKGKEALEELSRIFGKGKVLFVKTDVSKYEDFENAFKRTVEYFKNVDILVNNAGVMNDAIYVREVDINVKGVAHGCILALETYFQKYRQGEEAVIINISSVAGIKGYAYMPVYVGTKFAVIGMTLGWSTPFHYDRTKVRVIAFCPGATATALLDTSSKFIADVYEESVAEAGDLHDIQELDVISEELVKVVKYAKNGTIWVSEYNKPAYEYTVADRHGFSNNILKTNL